MVVPQYIHYVSWDHYCFVPLHYFVTTTKGAITLLLEAQAKGTYTLTFLIFTSRGIVLPLISKI